MGAVEKSVAVAPVGRVEQLPKTSRADSGVRPDPGGDGAAAPAVPDLEAALIGHPGPVLRLDRVDPGQRRRTGGQFRKKLSGAGPLSLQQDAFRIVQHPAGQAEAPGEREDMRTESHALDLPAYPDKDPPVFAMRHSPGPGYQVSACIFLIVVTSSSFLSDCA